MNLELLKELRCPETRQALGLAGPELMARLSALAERGELMNRAGRAVTPLTEPGLLRDDGCVFYPVRHGIPVMLVDESVWLEGEEGGESGVSDA